MDPKHLPIYELESELVAAAAAQRRLVIQAPAGSGKSTQIPQMLADRCVPAGRQIVVLQPRRLAARLLAARVAFERGVRLGAEVGYQVRFEDRSSPSTRIKFVTEGLLLRRMLSDPTLAGVGAVVFDEFHERHLYGDVSLAWALRLQETVRPDLWVLVMSATLPAAVLKRRLEPCALLASAGREFPVSVEYLGKPLDPRQSPSWQAAADACERLVAGGEDGDILVFMPGMQEIQRTVGLLRGSPASRGRRVLPLHGSLPARDQDAAVSPGGQPRIVVATNVAETSITIDGVTCVVDSGLARISRFDPYRGINTLLVEKISRASAEQRAGRAGRTRPGRCLRLWTEREHAERIPYEAPEVKRVDLAEILLFLRALGVQDPAAFSWLETPEPRRVEHAERLLRDLGAVDARTGALTEMGRRMVSFPAHPRYARMFLAAAEQGCVRSVALIAALTQDRGILLPMRAGEVREEREMFFGDSGDSDLLVLARAWDYARKNDYDLPRCRRLGIHAGAAAEVGRAVEHFLELARREGLPLETQEAPAEAVRRCVLAGFSDQLAVRKDQGTWRCDLVHGRTGDLARESVVRKAKLFVASDVREVGQTCLPRCGSFGQAGKGRSLKVLLGLATAVREEWLRELFPDDFTTAREIRLDADTRRVVAVEQQRFRDLVLETKTAGTPTAEEAAELLACEVESGRLTFRAWDAAVEQWVTRLNNLSEWCPELGLSALTEAERPLLFRTICLGAFSEKEARDRPVWPALLGRLTPAQRAGLDRHAPERLELPGGRQARLEYAPKAPPALAATIQDLFGVRGGFTVAMGRVPVSIHVLAPNRRAVQVTQDLAGFWHDAYPRVRQELQRKYPKHAWPETPGMGKK